MNFRGIPSSRRLRVRLLSEEDDEAKARKGYDPRKTAAENAGLESVMDRPDEDLDGPYADPAVMARTLAREGRGGDTEIAHVTRGGGRIGKRKAFI